MVKCEKALETGNGPDLPKRLATKLDEQKWGREDKALEKASSPVKSAEPAPTPITSEAKSSTSRETLANSSTQQGKRKASAPKEQKKGEKEEKQREELAEIGAIESDEESDAELVFDEHANETIKQNTGTGQSMQSSSANSIATPNDADAAIAM